MSRKFNYERPYKGMSEMAIKDYLSKPKDERETILVEIPKGTTDVLTGKFTDHKSLDRTKHISECSINILRSMTESLSLNVDYNLDHRFTSEEGASIEMALGLKRLGDALQYLSNSQSWVDMEIKSYDFDKIKTTLEMVNHHFEQSVKQSMIKEKI